MTPNAVRAASALRGSNNMKKAVSILCTLAFFCLIIAAMYTIVCGVGLNTGFYNKEYAELNTASYLGMSHNDLMKSTGTLLDYIKGDRADMVVNATINDVSREVFNEQEKAHMVDVAALFGGWNTYKTICLIVCPLIFTVAIFTVRENRLRFFARRYVEGAAIFFVILIAAGIWALVDFISLWTNFHLLFFHNDLWMLDPNTSVMINMFPEKFFNDMVIRIILITAAVILIPLAASIVYLVKKKKLKI